MDFSLKKYQLLLSQLLETGYTYQRFDNFLAKPVAKTVILRHDVDLRPANSLTFARIQADLGITGVYYFRAVPESWDERIIREIADMGHEIGYHYECLTTCNGDVQRAIQDFEANLIALQKLAPVSTICMHGSPMSRYDSKDLWKTNNYRDFGIVGEPYFDVDFTKVFYLTDTGRRWDGEKVSVRDKVDSGFDLRFRHTDEIISAARQKALPDKIMFTFHPQRWTDNPLSWTTELISQNAKNLVKRYFFIKGK
jgi:hypothetical protein